MSDKCIVTTPACNRAARATAALLMGTILVGCTVPGSGPGVSRYEPSYLRLTEERAFAEALRRHYLELATNAFDRGDVVRSDFYSLRALMAAEGKLAQPGKAARNLDAGGEAAAAGERLSMLLMSGARTRSPEVAARAQAAYDCWLVKSSSDGDAQIAQSCRYNALNAIAELGGGNSNGRLVDAGGPRAPEGQTYVIEAGAPSQVVSAHGVTIEVITEHGGYAAPQTYTAPQQQFVERTYASQAPEPARYTTVERAAPAYAVQTRPMMTEPQGVVAYDPAPMMMEEVGEPINVIPMPMQATMIEEPGINFGSMDFAEPMQAEIAMALVDLGPIESVPVFDTRPIDTMAVVEMAALPMGTGSEASDALLAASNSMRGDFAVFFGFDSDSVTLEGEDVLIDAVEQIKLSGAKRITLMGFTDSVGNARYNQLLAMRRAQSVRKYLQGALGSDVTFEILPVGEVQAVQMGGDGVKEALNRKVEIGML